MPNAHQFPHSRFDKMYNDVHRVIIPLGFMFLQCCDATVFLREMAPGLQKAFSAVKPPKESQCTDRGESATGIILS